MVKNLQNVVLGVDLSFSLLILMIQNKENHSQRCMYTFIVRVATLIGNKLAVLCNILWGLNQRTFTGTKESHGGGSRLILTHFLFLPVQLVGCTPTSGLWGLWNNHFTVLFIIAGQQSYTDSAESLRRAAVACGIHSSPLGVHCTVDLWSVQAWKYFMFIQPHFCLDVYRVYVHIFTCRCVFVISLRLFLHLFLTGKPQADCIGYTPLFLLHHPTPALFLSLPLVPLCNGTKALLGMAWHLLAHFVSSSFYVESFEKKFWVRSFIYLLIFTTFWVIWKNIGLTSLQTVACFYFCLSVGFLHEPKSTTATSKYSAAGSAARTKSTDIPLPVEQMRGRIILTDGFSQVCAWDKGLFLSKASPVQLQWIERIAVGW